MQSIKKETIYIQRLDASGKVNFFPSAAHKAKVSRYTFTAERMGGIPKLSCEIYSDTIIENWGSDVFVEFRGERMFLSGTPNVTKENDNIMYKYEIVFLSEREALDRVLFIDSVVEGDDTYHSNSIDASFVCDVRELATRINVCLKKRSIDYKVVVDDNIKSDAKYITIKNETVRAAVDKIFSEFNLQYRFEGRVIRVYSTAQTTITLGYQDGLLSISKENKGDRVLNRIYGVGGSDNIPFYYPNDTEYGNYEYFAKAWNGDIEPPYEDAYNPVEYIDYGKLSRFIEYPWKTLTLYPYIDGAILEGEGEVPRIITVDGHIPPLPDSTNVPIQIPEAQMLMFRSVFIARGFKGYKYKVKFYYKESSGYFKQHIKKEHVTIRTFTQEGYKKFILNGFAGDLAIAQKGLVDTVFELEIKYEGVEYVVIDWSAEILRNNIQNVYHVTFYTESVGIKEEYYLFSIDGVQKHLPIKDSGIKLKEGVMTTYDKLSVLINRFDTIEYRSNLMPSVYRDTNGEISYYDAISGIYQIPDDRNNTYKFENEFSDKTISEGFVEFNEIKPSIAWAKNNDGEQYGVIADIGFDDNDNDDFTEDGSNGSSGSERNYAHSYFYIRLNKFGGSIGFNLFEQAIEGSSACIEMTSGICAGCKFEIGVIYSGFGRAYRAYNPVLTTEDGALKPGDFDKKTTDSYSLIQENQQDTSSESVWIAVKKDNKSFGTLMPNVGRGYKPSVGDSFVITGVNLPKAYFIQAEEELKDRLIEHLKENNIEKFTYKVSLSRNYLARNTDVCDLLNENSVVEIDDNGVLTKQYVKSYSCKADDNGLLEIGIALDDEVTVKESTFISKVKKTAQSVIVEETDKSFSPFALSQLVQSVQGDYIRKDKEEYTDHLVDFRGGLLSDFATVKKVLSSADFVRGFGGSGWELSIDENDKSILELDKIVVRDTMNVVEFIIDRVKSIGGKLCISPANGKIKRIDDLGDSYAIEFEQDNQFVLNDLISCRTFRDFEYHNYWVRVAESYNNKVFVLKSDFEGYSSPCVGDECVLMGNAEIRERQSFILLSAAGDEQPRIDLFDGVNRTSFYGCLRTRVGHLDGIYDPWFERDKQPTGYGLYADNAFLRGSFLLTTGEDVKTKFEIVDGKISSLVESINEDMAGDNAFLSNNAFRLGLEKWDAQTTQATFFLVGGEWILSQGKPLSSLREGLSITNENGRVALRIKDSSITQRNENLASRPKIETNAQGKKEATTIHLNFFYKCTKEGTLTVTFDGVDKSGFEPFSSFTVEQKIDQTNGQFVRFSADGLWNGTGDFRIAFTGDIHISMLVLTTDSVGSLVYKYRTLFEQSDRIVKFAAESLNVDGSVLDSSSIVTEAKYNRLISERFNPDGSLINKSGLVTSADFSQLFSEEADSSGLVHRSEIGTFVEKDANGYIVSGVKIKGDQIELQGAISANDTFSIDTDGYMTATGGTIGGFEIGQNSIECNSGNSYLSVGDASFNAKFQSVFSSRGVHINNHAGTGYLDQLVKFNYFENRRVSADSGYNVSWQNIVVADIMDIKYRNISTDAIVPKTIGSYGYQYAMLGSGHIILDGVIDGSSISVIDSFNQNNSVRLLRIPCDSNRICISSKFDNCAIVLPDVLSMLSAIGQGIVNEDLTDKKDQPFTFEITLMNTGVKTIYFGGKNDAITDTSTRPFNREEFPVLYNASGTAITGLYTASIPPNAARKVILAHYGGKNPTAVGYVYKAFII